VAQDPLISQAKLIAEPWDVRPLEQLRPRPFPAAMERVNGRFRDTTRDWWRSQDRMLGDFASRLCGSADVYGGRGEGRRPSASVNFVTVHDGFTLADLVSTTASTTRPRRGQSRRHRRQPLVELRIEGPTTDPDVLALRARQQRAFLATLLFSPVCRCCWAATRPAAPSGATTTVLPG